MDRNISHVCDKGAVGSVGGSVMAGDIGRVDGQAKMLEELHEVEDTTLFVLRKLRKTRQAKIERIARCLRFASAQR